MKPIKYLSLISFCFLQLVVKAQAPAGLDTSFNQQVSRFRHGQKKRLDLPQLAERAKQMHLDALSDSIATDYIENHLYKQSDEHLIITKANVAFIGEHPATLFSGNQAYQFFSKHRTKIDKLMQDSTFSENVLFLISYKQITEPLMKRAQSSGKEPEWPGLTTTIAKKFGDEIASRQVLNAKIDWYKSIKDWKNYISYLTQRTDALPLKMDMSSVAQLNSAAWEVFDYSADRRELEHALTWSDKVVALNPQAEAMDTKANILYKLGKTKQAIELETKASDAEANAMDIKTNLAKMKKGERTWTEPVNGLLH